MRVAALQLSAQGLSSTKLYNYIRIAQKKGVQVLLLGEYTLNTFFKELETMPLAMIKEQAIHQMKVLKELSTTYNMVIVAPLVTTRGQKIYKSIVKFAPHSTGYYEQQILIGYAHWNEKRFFANDAKELKSPHIFKVGSFKFAIMAGYELHFDEMFASVRQKNVDAILVPSVSTFESYERWKSLILMRAFTNNCYILRANRIGEFVEENGHSWKFYGDSLLASPNGELLEHLGNKEELMIADLSHTEVVNARKMWGFREPLKRRD
ncbi:MAG: carbon-nitrogen hydrolase family protein [Epsilonproteobacteria bacterium]|nr:carbon-nitrogen hydrolase family protein [Campylobacterota bacterium]